MTIGVPGFDLLNRCDEKRQVGWHQKTQNHDGLRSLERFGSKGEGGRKSEMILNSTDGGHEKKERVWWQYFEFCVGCRPMEFHTKRNGIEHLIDCVQWQAKLMMMLLWTSR